jgi:DNA sulfur modification protein DndE
MVEFKIKTSENNRQIISTITGQLGLGAENVIARLAFAYSIGAESKLDVNKMQDAKGKEYSSKVLFGDNLPYYIAILSNKYNIHKSNKDISKYVKLHVDDGLGKIYSMTNKRGMDFLFDSILEGLNKIK